nr:GBS Bsp-like repeat-containing protein [Enterococcus sp. BWB1-3]
MSDVDLENGYYEPSNRSDLSGTGRSRISALSAIDVVQAGEANRPAAHFIDVSSHNGTISVAQYNMMKTYGVTGVVVKLTEGTTYYNPYAASQVQNARAAGMTVSVYHYSHYTSAAGAQAEAAFFAGKASILGLSKSTVMVSDIEESAMKNSSVNSNTNAFKEKLNGLGYNRVAYYLSRSWLDADGGLFNTSMFGKNNIWVAQYPYTPTASQKWNSDYASWQWSSNYYFPGISHAFDINTDYLGLFTGGSNWSSDIPVTGTVSVADTDGTETKFRATAKIEAGGYIPQNVYFATWSDKNGKDDLIWYPATLNNDGTWSTDIDISRHKTDGSYTVHTYAKMNNSTQLHVATNTFNVNQPTMSVSFDKSNAANGTFDVIVTPSSKSAISRIRVPMWSQANQSDLVWYTATKQSNGTYKATMSVSNHKNNTGDYTVHVYMDTANGFTVGKNAGKVTVGLGTVKGTTTITDSAKTETTYKAEARINMGGYGTPSNVYFATWSAEKNKTDLRWYAGTKTSSGTYTSSININNHKASGIYYVHTYVKLSNGDMKHITTNTFTVSQPTMSVSIDKSNAANGTFDVIVTPSSKSAISRVRVPMWSKSNQSDLVWYTATKQSNGTYKAIMSVSKHNYNIGDYTVHIYMDTVNGITVGKNMGRVTVGLGTIKGTTTITDSAKTETTFNAEIKLDMAGYGKPSTVYFAVWSAAKNKTDLRWYTGTQTTSGTYAASININNHKSAGTYYVHTYVKLSNGDMKHVASNTFTVSQPTMSVKIDTSKAKSGTIDVIVMPNSKAAVSSVRVPIWNQANQSDLIWYTATKESNGTYKATMSISKHKNKVGDYTIHVYMDTANGFTVAKSMGKVTVGK